MFIKVKKKRDNKEKIRAAIGLFENCNIIVEKASLNFKS